MLNDPVMWIGVDIGVKRDTAAVASVIKNRSVEMYGVWGCRIFQPPVNIPTTVVALLHYLLTHHRVAQVLYDPYQFYSEASRLVDAGYGDLLYEVNQQSEMTEYANTLDTNLKQETLLFPFDDEIRSHFSWTVARQTERGLRIDKRRQSRPIDAVVAITMALAGATRASGSPTFPEYRQSIHGRSLAELP